MTPACWAQSILLSDCELVPGTKGTWIWEEKQGVKLTKPSNMQEDLPYFIAHILEKPDQSLLKFDIRHIKFYEMTSKAERKFSN